jgi:hypothetical protein
LKELQVAKQQQLQNVQHFFTNKGNVNPNNSLQSEWQSSRKQSTNAREDTGEKQPSYTAGGIVNQCNHYRSVCSSPQTYSFDPVTQHLGVY